MSKKITELTADASPALTSLLESVKDPSGTPLSRKVTFDALLALYDARTATMTNKTLTSPTITTPTIADFTNAAHDHGDTDDGGVLVAAAIGLTTQGDIPYRDGSGLARLAAGTAGRHLETGGAGANPSWADPPYTIQFLESAGVATPADSTTYYIGFCPSTNSTTGAVHRMHIPRAGAIVAAYLNVVVEGTLGTTETSTVSIRLNNTTDTTLSSSVQTNAAFQTYSNTALNIAVAAGDYIEIKWVTPAFSTNPTTVRVYGSVYIS